MARFGVQAQVVAPNQPGAFAPVGNTTTETSIWGSAVGAANGGTPRYGEVPQHLSEPGQAYLIQAGGRISSKASPVGTLQFKMYWGQDDATLGNNTAIGTSASGFTLFPSLTDAPWFMQYTLAIATIDNPAAAWVGSIRGAGYAVVGTVNHHLITMRLGATFANMENDNKGLLMSAKWGTADALNTIVCDWVNLAQLN